MLNAALIAEWSCCGEVPAKSMISWVPRISSVAFSVNGSV
jgi:hypothetical protein